jgi:hypothetical protein
MVISMASVITQNLLMTSVLSIIYQKENPSDKLTAIYLFALIGDHMHVRPINLLKEIELQSAVLIICAWQDVPICPQT